MKPKGKSDPERSRSEKEAEFLRLAEKIGLDRARQIVREMAEEERRQKLRVN